jgi:hypothetical protein
MFGCVLEGKGNSCGQGLVCFCFFSFFLPLDAFQNKINRINHFFLFFVFGRASTIIKRKAFICVGLFVPFCLMSLFLW